MNSPPRSLNFDDVLELCGSVSTSRGRAYKANGHVLELEWLPEGNVLYSTVRGSATEPYTQRTVIAAHRLHGECSCPTSQNCKHVAAALLLWIDRQASSDSGDDQNLRAVNRWLQRLVEQGVNQDPALERQTPGEPLLFYQLDQAAVNQGLQSVTLEIVQSRLLKRGGYGKETPYRYHSHYYHPDWVQPSDRAILELATGRQADLTYQTLRVEGGIGHLLMNKLVATGRCFWGPDRDRSLQLDAPRQLDIQWQAGSIDVRLKANLPGCDHWYLIPTDPPWYVDEQHARAGLLQGAPSSGVLSQLLLAPPLPVEHVQAISNYIASRLPDPALPLPLAPDFLRVDVPPEPVLVLQTREDSPDIRHFFASIRFRYGDYLLPYDGAETEATLDGKTPDGQTLILHRDLSAEARHAVDFSRRFPAFEQAMNSDGGDYYSRADRQPRTRDVRELARLWQQLVEVSPDLEANGWKVHRREPFDLSFEPVTGIEATVSETTSAWFDMALKLHHKDQHFDLLPLVVEWLQTGERDRPILLQADDGQWLEVAPELFAPVADTLQELFSEATTSSRLRLSHQRAAAAADLERQWQAAGVKVAWQNADELFGMARRLQEYDRFDAPELPDSLQASLRGYQLDGVAWLGFLAHHGFNGILADDMGLGKTLQALTHVLVEIETGRLSKPALIVAPTSLLSNWQREAIRFTPTLRTRIWHGSERWEQGSDFADLDIVITSYALVTRDIELLATQQLGCVILDEAQAIKNPAAKVTQALKSLPSERRVCLTGTPLENHLGELWSQFDFLMPGFLGTRKQFNRQFRTPIESHGNVERQQRLSQLIRPYLLRRRKEQVASELPPKTEIVRTVTLEGQQARLYESIRVTMEQRVRQLLSEQGLARSHIEMLDALLKLRQTCCHPALVKLDTARGVNQSAKTELLLEMLDELIDEGKKILLFSQFTEMLGLIEQELEQRGIRYVKLTGRSRNRQDIIDAFQHGDVPLFLISLKAGGTGLNLTAADTVIHYDPWWNPAVEAQASDRAHRIGQDKPVFIYKLVAANTVEEKILLMQDEKRQLAESTLDQAEPSNNIRLQPEDYLALFAPEEPDSEPVFGTHRAPADPASPDSPTPVAPGSLRASR